MELTGGGTSNVIHPLVLAKERNFEDFVGVFRVQGLKNIPFALAIQVPPVRDRSLPDYLQSPERYL